MENKKVVIGIVVICILIVLLIGVSFYYNKFNTEQIAKLEKTIQETLTLDLTKEEMNQEIQTKDNYGVIEESFKNLLLEGKNAYKKSLEVCNQINANDIIKAENVDENDLEFTKIHEILNGYINQIEGYLDAYTRLTDSQNIESNAQDKFNGIRKEYFTELYIGLMQSEGVKNEFEYLKENIELVRQKAKDRVSELEEVLEFLKENKKHWKIENGQIQITHTNKLVEYYKMISR